METTKVKYGGVCSGAGVPADKTQHVQLLTGPEAPLLPRHKGQNNFLVGVKQTWRHCFCLYIDEVTQPHLQDQYLALARLDGARWGLCAEVGQLAKAEDDRELSADILQGAQQVAALACHAGRESEAMAGAGHQGHWEAWTGHSQLHTALACSMKKM